ncbi:MAG: hypothetical protein NT135_00275 [Candidatus Berkelbacteria bacterium]|nr:hypothetical protein [Candidatus Berkelbacteria bacterium]
MKTKNYILVATLVYVVIVVALSLWLSLPRKGEVTSKVPQVKTVSEESFKNPVISQISGLTQFGQVPVTIDKTQQGKDNPFQ